MLEAAFWGGVGGFSLLLGAVAALLVPVSTRVTAVIMAFGAGVLMSTLAHQLTLEAYERGGGVVLVGGALAGAVAFYLGNLAIARYGGAARKRSGEQQKGASGTAILLGTVMDGVPESAVIGISLLGGHGISVAVVVAVFLSNIPESLSATSGMRTAGRGARYVLGVWVAVLAVSALSSLAGFTLLGGAPTEVVGLIEAFAAGAILMMLADTMMPEAFENGGNRSGLATVVGFLAAYLLSENGG